MSHETVPASEWMDKQTFINQNYHEILLTLERGGNAGRAILLSIAMSHIYYVYRNGTTVDRWQYVIPIGTCYTDERYIG